jgi:hypothetical protein
MASGVGIYICQLLHPHRHSVGFLGSGFVSDFVFLVPLNVVKTGFNGHFCQSLGNFVHDIPVSGEGPIWI